jgi:D-3-phosphoglycerate dehydrogenase
MKVLLTSTSFQDTPGKHQELLKAQGYELDTMRGPLNEEEMLAVIADYDAVICGDDEYTARVLDAGSAGRLKYISKYGVGLDKIDLAKAKELGIPVTNCPGVNQVSVSEHVFALLLSHCKNIHLEYNVTKAGGWKRYVNREIFGKTIGVVGFGAIGKEVAKRAIAFGLDVVIFDIYLDRDYAAKLGYTVADSFRELASMSDIISFHVPHTPQTEELINDEIVRNVLKPGVIVINTSRGRLVNNNAIKFGLDSEIISGYLADVLDIEPMPPNYEMKDWPNVLITPHIGSRTYESVERQGTFAVKNLIEMVRKEEQCAVNMV